MAEPVWADSPYTGRPLPPDIISVDPGRGCQVRILSTQLVGVWTHWIASEQRTQPCTGPQGVCDWNHEKTSMKWEGWLAVQRPTVRRLLYLRVTDNAVKGCKALEDKRTSLRGRTLHAFRLGASIRSKMCVQLLDYPADERGLFAEPNTFKFLRQLWGKNAISTPDELPLEAAALVHDAKQLDKAIHDERRDGKLVDAAMLAQREAVHAKLKAFIAETWPHGRQVRA